MSDRLVQNWTQKQKRSCLYESLYNNLREYTQREDDPQIDVMFSKAKFVLKKLTDFNVINNWKIVNNRKIEVNFGRDDLRDLEIFEVSISLRELRVLADEHKTEEIIEI